ncbi:MAG: hypothetical protein COA79_05605 [Planctomycetota bacterium]|nr:MAG: hypothetical protein COA79_05605 [Planctomycetota bacterium]
MKPVIIWGSECKLPDGKGLSFGGQHQKADDGRPHTRIWDGSKWVSIKDELHSKNPLQPYHDNLWKIRTDIRDTLGKARYIFFEGRELKKEKAFLAKEVNPSLEKILEDLRYQKRALISLNKLTDYSNSQLKLSLELIDKVIASIMPFAERTELALLATIRQAQINLELASEKLDAEPPARVCSKIVYDTKNKMYLIFGGDHYEYLTNDVWVFDTANKIWMQKHPKESPEPRANHRITANGDGTVTAVSGYKYAAKFNYSQKPYEYVGQAKWTYDLSSDKWSGQSDQKLFPANMRVYRAERFLPEYYMKGKRPNAKENEAKLKSLPVNTWIAMNPPMKPQKEQRGRDWGTSVLDFHNDLILQWGGGHSAHGGTDTLHYHISTNRWEQVYPVEYCLGLMGSPSHYPCGYNFNGHPWIIMHAYKSYAYEPALKKMIITGRNVNWSMSHDTSFYLYDGLTGAWGKRYPLHKSMLYVQYYLKSRVVSGPEGLLYWNHNRSALKLNTKSMQFETIKVDGTLPKCGTDGGGLVYDSKRNRMLMVTKPWKPMGKGTFLGNIYSLDLNTNKLTVLTPKGSSKLAAAFPFLREAVYNPEADLFLWAGFSNDKMLAYEPKGNRWVLVNVKGKAPLGFSSGHIYDAKRKLHFVATGKGNVYGLRLDLSQANLEDL